MSLNPYSFANPQELKTPPVFCMISGSAASAAMARPMNAGVSEAMKCGNWREDVKAFADSYRKLVGAHPQLTQYLIGNAD